MAGALNSTVLVNGGLLKDYIRAVTQSCRKVKTVLVRIQQRAADVDLLQIGVSSEHTFF